MHRDANFGDPRSVTCRVNTHINNFYDELKVRYSRSGWPILMCDQGSLVGLCVEDYKSLCAAVTVYLTSAEKLSKSKLFQ